MADKTPKGRMPTGSPPRERAERTSAPEGVGFTAAWSPAVNGAGRAHEPSPSTEPGRSRGLTLRVVAEGVFATHNLPAAGDVLIGRSEKADIRIEDPSISRRHAVLRVSSALTIEDLGSANGTRIGDRRLLRGERVEIAVGEVLDLGSVMMIVQPGIVANRPRRLWAHGYFEGRLEDECARAERSAGTFAVVRVRVEGSLPSSAAEEVLGSGLRAMDMVAAYGPREYELLLLDVSPEQAERVVSDVVTQLQERGADVRAGLACYPRDGRAGDVLVAHACAMLLGRTAAEREAPPLVVDGVVKRLARLIDRIAAGIQPVLLLGEAGVGKEVFAEMIHRRSSRGSRPLHKIRCGTLDEVSLDQALFGDPAAPSARGLLERADGSTLFLAEVGELPPRLQQKLARALESQQSPRSRGQAPRRLDVRIVAASTRDLAAEVARGRFSRDLYEHLAAVSLLVPPLRERGSEIEGLARAFIAHAARQANRHPPPLAEEALALLLRYGWPGNIRELRNVVERAVLLGAGEITLRELPIEKMVATLASRALAPWASIQEDPTVVAPLSMDLGAPAVEPPEPRRSERRPTPAPAAPRRKRG